MLVPPATNSSTIDTETTNDENEYPQLLYTKSKSKSQIDTQQKIHVFVESAKYFPLQKKSKIDEQLIVMIAKKYHPLRFVEEPEFNKLVTIMSLIQFTK